MEIGSTPLRNIIEESSDSDSDREEDSPKTAKTPPLAGPAPAPLTPAKKEKVEEKVEEKENKEKVEEKEKEKKKEEEKEEPFKEDKELSFQKFCSLHFQGNASHTHINQRLRQPLLAHQDERDSLVRLLPSTIFVKPDCFP